MAKATNGTIKLDASLLEDIDRRDGYMYAKRDENGRSLMSAQVISGNLSIKIGL
jgi:hypothetical protein